MHAYPPARHLLRDLGVRVSSERGISAARAAVTPGVLGADGAARASFLAVLVDVAGGRTGAQHARPGTVVTQDLGLHVLAPLGSGEALARVRVLRDSRSQVRFDVGVSDAHGRLVARASMTSAKLERRSAHEPSVPRAGEWLEFALPDSGVGGSLAEYAGWRSAGERALELELDPSLCNGLGILHGAVQGMLLEAAAEHAALSAGSRRAVTADLSVSFLAPGRRGPFRAEAELLRAAPQGGLARVELVDLGHAGALVAVAWVGLSLA